MTLVVAYCDGKNIAVVSDTALTIQSESFRSKPWMGTLKSIPIDEYRFISFAGVVTALDIIRDIWTRNIINYIPTQQILEILIERTRSLNEKPDFIVGEVVDDTANLFKISEGKLESNLKNAWIGSLVAFNHYQELYHGYKENKDKLGMDPSLLETHELTRIAMSRAMDDLIDDDKDSTVGGFCILLHSSSVRVLKYSRSAVAYNNFQIPEDVIEDEWFTVPFGTRATGGWNCSIQAPAQAGIACVAMFILQAQLTMVFIPMVTQNFLIYGNQEAGRKIVNKMFGFDLIGPTFS